MTHVFIEERLFNTGGALAKLVARRPLYPREIDGRDFYFLGTQLWHGDRGYAVYLAMIIAMSYFTCPLDRKAGAGVGEESGADTAAADSDLAQHRWRLGGTGLCRRWLRFWSLSVNLSR